MVRRLLALLLIWGLALPAVAAPLHCVPPAPEPVPAAMMMHGHHGHDDGHGMAGPSPAKPMPPGQDCIGCATLRPPAPPPAPPVLRVGPAPSGPRLTALHGHRAAPETPPPRFLS